MMKELKIVIKTLLKEGIHPNDIIEEVQKVIEADGQWNLWGDGRWRLDTVCSICGSGVPGICGHETDGNQRVIMRSEYKSPQ